MKLDKVVIRKRLEQYAGRVPVRVTLNRKLAEPRVYYEYEGDEERIVSDAPVLSSYISDTIFVFNFNPSKIRSDKKLESLILSAIGDMA